MKLSSLALSFSIFASAVCAKLTSEHRDSPNDLNANNHAVRKQFHLRGHGEDSSSLAESLQDDQHHDRGTRAKSDPAFNKNMAKKDNEDLLPIQERKLNLIDWNLVGQVIAGEDRLDLSGESVSISEDGMIVAIGARHNDGDSGNVAENSGHVRVYEYSGVEWVQLGSDIDGEFSQDNFGHTLQLCGNGLTLAVGAPEYDLPEPALRDAGYVRIFRYDEASSDWQQIGNSIKGDGIGDRNGFSVALSFDGSIVAVGAPDNDLNGNDRGYARVFKHTSIGNVWEQVGSDIDGENAYDKSGYSVSLNKAGNIIAVGAIFNDEGGTNAGHVRVWEWNSTAAKWEQLGDDIDGYYGGEYTGYSVSLSSTGDTLAVGSPNECSRKGMVEVFRFVNNSWETKGDILYGTSYEDFYGRDVSLSDDGDRLAVGSPFGDDGTGAEWKIDNGKVQVYEYDDDTSTWTELGSSLGGDTTGDVFGYSVSLAGNGATLVVGSPYSAAGSNYRFAGVIKVFDLDSEDTGTPLTDDLGGDDGLDLVPPETGEPAEPTEPPVGGGGDPHFRSFTGDYFSFHGQCDLVLVKSLGFHAGLGLDVHIRTTRVDNVHFQYSYISSFAMKIGDSVLEIDTDGTLISEDPQLLLGPKKLSPNDSTIDDPENERRMFAGNPVTTSFKGRLNNIIVHDISLGGDKSIEVRANTKTGILFVDIHGTFPDSMGLLGSSDGMYGRDGVTDMDGLWNTLGEEWQVRDTEPQLFLDVKRIPQYPYGCAYESMEGEVKEDSRHRRRLMSDDADKKFEAAALKACDSVSEALKDFCFADVVALRDLDVADDPFYSRT